MNNYIAIFLVVLCGLLRSTDLFFRTPDILGQFPVITLAFWEHLMNSLVFIPIIFGTKQKLKDELLKINSKDIILFLLVGIGASALGLICFTSSFAHINPAIAIIFQKTQPIFIIILSSFFLKEKITPNFIIHSIVVLLCVIGITYQYNPAQAIGSSPATGALYAIAAAFFWGGGTVWGKELMKKYSPLLLTGMRFFIGTIFTLIMALYLYGDLKANLLLTSTSDANNNFYQYQILYMALISGTLAVSCFYFGLKHVKASLVGILELSFPVFSVMISWLFFNKPLTIMQIFLSILLFIESYNATQESNNTCEKGN